MRVTVKRVLLALLGRSISCERCGAELFTAVPFVWRGRIKLLGAEAVPVRVDFESMNRLVFSHIEPNRCPALRRWQRSTS